MSATATNQRGRLGDAQLIPTLAVAGLTAATAVSFCRVFADWSYLQPVLVVALGTHLMAMLLRVARVHVVASLPLLLGTVVELLALAYHRDSMLHGLLPGSDSISLLRADLREVVMQFPTAIAPVASGSSWPRAAAAVLGVCAVMADTFAFRANGRAETVAPCAVVFVFVGALGIETHRVSVAALWIAAALTVIAVLRFRSSSTETAWMGARRLSMAAALPTMLGLVAVASVAALAVGPRLPGAGATPLYDTRHRAGSVTEIVSPIVDIGGSLRERGNQELFTIESQDGGHYWRLTGLPVFNGQTWELGDEDLQAMGDRAAEITVSGTTSGQLITIKALGGHLVPSAYRPVRVSPEQVVWAPQSQSLVLPDTELKRGDTIAVDAEIIRPSADQLRLASVGGANVNLLELPDGVPSSVTDAAQNIAAGATNPYDIAMALQNWFRTEFAYDVEVDFGNDGNAMAEFLAARRGFCQQFAGTFAVMARSLGLPTRVAVGFTPGDVDSEGNWHVYGRHAHAWPEVWFDGLGWIAFEPTPGRGNGDAVGYTGVAAEQAAGGGGDGVTGSTTVNTTDSTTDGLGTAPPPTGPDDTDTGEVGGTTPVSGTGGDTPKSSGTPWVFLGISLGIVLWVLVAPRVVRAMVHRHDDTAADRVVSAWRHSIGVLSLAGAPMVRGATPSEYAHVAQEATGIDHRAVRELARHVTSTVYSTSEANRDLAERCELLAHEIDVQCRDRIPWRTRLQAMFDPRLMRRRYTG